MPFDPTTPVPQVSWYEREIKEASAEQYAASAAEENAAQAYRIESLGSAPVSQSNVLAIDSLADSLAGPTVAAKAPEPDSGGISFAVMAILIYFGYRFLK